MDLEGLNSIMNQIENLTVVKNETKVKTPAYIWAEICNIPVDDKMKIMDTWKHFNPGTSIYTIWEWFEDEYHLFIDQLVYYALNVMYGSEE